MRKITMPMVLSVFLLTSLRMNAQNTYPVNDVANPKEGCYAFINILLNDKDVLIN